MKTKFALRVKQLWIKQSKLAKDLRISKTTVYLWYNWKSKPNIDNARRIAEYLNDRIENLF